MCVCVCVCVSVCLSVAITAKHPTVFSLHFLLITSKNLVIIFFIPKCISAHKYQLYLTWIKRNILTLLYYNFWDKRNTIFSRIHLHFIQILSRQSSREGDFLYITSSNSFLWNDNSAAVRIEYIYYTSTMYYVLYAVCPTPVGWLYTTLPAIARRSLCFVLFLSFFLSFFVLSLCHSIYVDQIEQWSYTVQ